MPQIQNIPEIMRTTEIKPASDGNYYFAYVRKSTAGEKKQATSLFEQYSDITILAKKLHINPIEIRFYEESKSAFNVNKHRKELARMQRDIESVKNKSGEKIILSSIISRLARHRIVGDYFVEALIPQDRRKIPLINKIYNNGKVWTNQSKRTELQNAFDIASNESEEKRDFEFNRRKSYLESGRFRMITRIGFVPVGQTQ